MYKFNYSGRVTLKTIINLSKLDVVKQQWETAIRLYFSLGDPVSIHTLVAASYNVIRDININIVGEALYTKDEFMKNVKPGRENAVRKNQ